jgi:hypothetical protein
VLKDEPEVLGERVRPLERVGPTGRSGADVAFS